MSDVKAETQSVDTAKVEVPQTEAHPDIQGLKQGMAKIQANYDVLYADHKKLIIELEEKRKETMTAKEREAFEKTEFEKKLSMKEQELNTERLKFEKTKILSELQYDADLLGVVTGDDIDTFKNNVKTLNDKIAKIVEKQVNERLSKGNPPPQSGKVEEGAYSLEELRKMSETDITKNYDKVLRSYRVNTERS